MAQAQGLDLAPAELDRLAPPLEALEETFRPLVKSLTADLEPAVEFRMEDVEDAPEGK